MEYEVSKKFIKTAKKLSENNREMIREMFDTVKKAEMLEDIPNCQKLTGYSSVYRIRLGELRAFFVFYISVEDDGVLKFEYLIQRGEAYKKEMKDKLQKKDI